MGNIRKFNPGSQPPYTKGALVVIGLVGLVDFFSEGMVSRLFETRGIDVQYGEYWRLLTMGLVHSSFMHIAFNMYALWVLGGMYERLAGGKWMLGIFIVSILASSSMGALIYDVHIPMLGASGGVYGLFAAVLAYFYAKIGSIRGMLNVPQSRQLLMWLGIGVIFSIVVPNVSLLGHVAGFVPGAILGYYYEHWHSRTVDVYHRASAVLVVALTVIVAAYACFPIGRASFDAVRAMKAYEAGRMERGDELLEKAEDGKRQDDGTLKLISHLKLWREYAYQNRTNDMEALTWPLLSLKGIGKHKEPFGWVTRENLGLSITTVDETTPDVEDAGTKREDNGD